MHIVFFHRKMVSGRQSIEENFNPLVNELKKKHKVDVYHLPYSTGTPFDILRNCMFVRKYACKDGINHISGDVHYAVLGLIGKKSVVTIHDDYSVTRARHGFLDKLYRWLFYIFLPLVIVDAPVCTTPENLRRIKKLYNTKKLRVITHQHPSNQFKRSSKPFNKECPRFLQIGTESNKNLETTLKVVAGMKCKLIILKPMTEEQKKMANKFKVDYVNRYDLPFCEVVKEYDQADIILFPSLYEGLGMPIMEGQHCGKPVITSDLSPMNWAAGDGAVLLKDPLNVDEYRKALNKIINDDDFRNKLIAKGIENSKRFTCEEGVRQYEMLYKELLEK